MSAVRILLECILVVYFIVYFNRISILFVRVYFTFGQNGLPQCLGINMSWNK